MFPTANSVVYYNEDGEVLGWDTYREEDPYDEHDFATYDEEYDPEDCDHTDVFDIVKVGVNTFEGMCDWCESPVRFSGEGASYEAHLI